MVGSGLGAHARPLVVRLVLGASVAAIASGLAAPAQAQCSPDPTVQNGTTTCTGQDPNGLRVTTPGTTVTVASGATVNGSGAPAIVVDTPSPGSSATVGLNVQGIVDGGTAAGVSLLSASSGFGAVQLDVTVGAGGRITGATGVTIGRNPANNGFPTVTATVDNAGRIEGTSGAALGVALSGFGGFQSITNRAGGTIGAIAAPVGTLGNAGLIDGGTASAINAGGTTGATIAGTWTNTGTITSASATGTIAGMAQGTPGLVNAGIVRNTGTGAALSGDHVTVRNSGTISAAGGTAVSAGLALALTNTGTITGDVRVGTPSGFGFSGVVDSSAGTINGNVTFGAGSDTLVARYTGGPVLQTGITGTIDGGAGFNAVQILAPADLTIATPVVLPATFQRLRLTPSGGATVTLAPGFAPPGTVELTGIGTVVNAASFVTTGNAFSAPINNDRNTLDVTNTGSVRTTNGVAFDLASVDTFRNAGTIDVTAGVGVGISTSNRLVNTGTIGATGTGVAAFATTIENAGTIRSSGGIALAASGSTGTTVTNTGRIEGGTFGVVTSILLANSGTVTGRTAGVRLDAYGGVSNAAGGVISGARSISNSGASFNMTVANAGTLNGDVVLADQANGGSNNTFIALPGGVLNGNLVLGTNGRLVTQLVNTGPGAFAGITGTVSVTNGSLRYRVGQDASATLAATPAPFTSVGYELANDARLTLSAPGTVAQPLLLAGAGSVDITADFAVSTQAAIQSTSVTPDPGTFLIPANALAITSRGTIALTRVGSTTIPVVAVALGTGDRFTNAGAITLTGANITAIAGGTAVTNSGRITGTASANSIGISSGGRVTSTGTIETSGTGVSLTLGTDGPGSLVNAGTITSLNNPGVVGQAFGATVENLAGGVIGGRSGIALRGGTVLNAGTINGTVQLTVPPQGGFAYEPGVFVSAGGTVNGNVLFGAGDDLFLQLGDTGGVTGRVVGGAGFDIYGRSYAASADVALGLADLPDFEAQLVQARGAGTTVTLTGATATGVPVYVGGDGRIVNRADVGGAVSGYVPQVFNGASVRAALGSDLVLAEFRNEGTIAGGFAGRVLSFTNAGRIGSQDTDAEVTLVATGDLRFENAGTILTAAGEDAVDVSVDAAGAVSFSNAGAIGGAVEIDATFDRAGVAGTVAIANSGAVTTTAEETNALSLEVLASAGSAAIRLDNAGTLSAGGAASRAALLSLTGNGGGLTYAVTNSGTMEANGGGEVYSYRPAPGQTVFYTEPASALAIVGPGDVAGTVTNTATGRIAATAARSTALGVIGGPLDLTNAGVIAGGDGTLLDPADNLAVVAGTRYLAGAIQTLGLFGDVVRNTGTITGSIDLGAGDDRIENRGTIAGPVFLREGDDRFVLAANAVLGGVVDGGDGTDAIAIEATTDGAVSADRFANFETLTQSGPGTVTYAGTFGVDTIRLTGGGLRVAAGTALATTGAVTVTGSDAVERVEVAGTLTGAVALGAGDDTFTETGAGRATGGVDGGAGVDLYRVVLAGDRTGLSANTGFETLAVEGSGTLALAQAFDAVTLAGTGLDVAAGVAIGSVVGSAGSERVSAAGDLARVALGAGDDSLTLGAATLAGVYAGDAGTDTLTLANPNAVRLDGAATGFERVVLASGSLSVAGTLGAAGDSLAFGDGAQGLTLLAGGRLAGAIDLGAGDDRLRLAAGSTIAGSVAGGAGSDIATIELAGDRSLAATTLTGFERLATEGAGTLSLTGGAFAYDRVDMSGSLRVASGASLSTAALAFGSADNRFTIEGGFAGSVSGGAGTDTIDVSGGSEAAPIAFANVSEVEAFRMTGGFATVSGTGALGAADLIGGRLVGLAGSTITAATIAVRQGATFGSAGTVNGALTVAGTLSPGASPGTMAVNGNVALAGTSVSVFEITPTVYDRLVVNGSLSIAQGATLQLVPTGAIAPGTTLDLITASGGISGSFTNLVKPASLLGFLVQDSGRIRLLGQFRTDATFGTTTNATIAYTNAVLAGGRASAALLAAAPRLVNASGVSNAQAFAAIAPEAYASVRQAAVENGLAIADTGRGEGFAVRRDTPGLYTFGQFSGVRRTLTGDAARARFNGYGVLGGLGYAGDGWSVGAFGGWLDGRQRIDALAARSDLDGGVAGIHARADRGGFGLTATLAWSGTDGTTRRTLFDGAVQGRYDLDTWTADIAASYDVALGGDWALRPRIGATAIRTERGAVAETGGSAFAAQVAGDTRRAAFVDGTLKLVGGEETRVRSYAAVGVRYQVAGRDAIALAGFGGGGLGLVVDGVTRARALGTASLGVEADIAPRLTLYGAATAERGRGDHREAVRAGVRLGF